MLVHCIHRGTDACLILATYCELTLRLVRRSFYKKSWLGLLLVDGQHVAEVHHDDLSVFESLQQTVFLFVIVQLVAPKSDMTRLLHGLCRVAEQLGQYTVGFKQRNCPLLAGSYNFLIHKDASESCPGRGHAGLSSGVRRSQEKHLPIRRAKQASPRHKV